MEERKKKSTPESTGETMKDGKRENPQPVSAIKNRRGTENDGNIAHSTIMNQLLDDETRNISNNSEKSNKRNNNSNSETSNKRSKKSINAQEELSDNKLTIIAVYNYKGGVAKTTNVINIGTAFARRGVKTLLVDADPQCNLTTFFLPQEEQDSEEDEEENEEEAQEEVDLILPNVKRDALNPRAKCHELDSYRNDATEPSIYSALRPIFSGDYSNMVAPDPKCVRENIWLLPGSTELVRFERPLGLTDSLEEVAVVYNGAFRRLITLVAKAVGARVVLVDFGPSSGIVNKVFVMSCDYILPPSFADYFSLSSVDGLLNHIFPMWIKWHKDLLKKQREILKGNHPQKNFAFNPTIPGLLPFVITTYRIYRKYVAKPSSAWIMDLKNLVEGSDIPAEVKSRYKPFGSDMVIPLLDHAGQLIQYSHASQTPFLDFQPDYPDIFAKISSRDKKDFMKKVNNARHRYASLCSALLQLSS